MYFESRGFSASLEGDDDGNAMKDELPTGDSLQNELNLCFQDWIPELADYLESELRSLIIKMG